MRDEGKQLVRELAAARERAKEVKEAEVLAFEAQKATPEGLAYRALADQYEKARDAETAAYSALTQWAVTAFAIDGDKKPAPGVTVRVRSRWDYDEEDATKWAHLRCPGALILSYDRYVKVAEVLGGPGRLVSHGQAFVARNLPEVPEDG